MEGITRLYPLPAHEQLLKGTYLEHNLRGLSHATGKAFVYANFVSSLGGRIAIPDTDGPGMMVPKNVANARDWRLF